MIGYHLAHEEQVGPSARDAIPRASTAAYLDRHGFLGPRLFAAHARYVDAGEIALLGRSRTVISHQAGMAANRGVIPRC